MQDQYQTLVEQSKWQRDNNVTQNKIREPLRELITSHGSLTKALTQLGSDFSVNVLSQKLDLPLFHEQHILNRALHRKAIIRQVELRVDNNLMVFARSILPLSLVEKTQTGLANLGQKPLGHLLFKEGEMRVSKRQFAQTSFQGKSIYARRTPYQYMGSSILVSEFFLPNVEQLLTK